MKKINYIIILLLLLLFISSSILYAIPEPGEIDNVAPIIDLSAKPKKKPVDIVIMTDYTGAKLTALNTQINALKAKFYSVNVEPVFHIVSDIKNTGIQQDEIYMFRRYARYNFYVLKRERYSPNQGWARWYNYWDSESVIWEETQGLASQYKNLPKRNPTNITFSKSYKTTTTNNYDMETCNVTIRCSNDIKAIDMVSVQTYYDNWYNGYYNKIDIQDGTDYVAIDTTWTREEKISDVSYTLYSLNFDKLNTLPLRAGSDRHMIFLSDAVSKDYSKGFGNYFCFGDLTNAINDYIENNKFTLYGVVPDAIRDMRLLPDKVNDILALGDTTLFHMKNGEIWKLGDPVYANTEGLPSGTKLFPEAINNIGKVKQICYTFYGPYMLMDNGTIKYFKDNKFVTILGLSNIKGIYCSSPSSNFLYLLDNSGKIFTLSAGGNNQVVAYNNSIAFTNIVFADSSPVFLTSTGIPYVWYTKKVGDTYTENNYERLKIQYYDNNYNEVYRDAPAIKSIENFRANAYENSLSPIAVLYTNGTVQQFSFSTKYIYDSRGISIGWGPCLYEDPAYSFHLYSVDSIESGIVCVFIYMKNGTTRMLNTNWVQDSYEDKRGRTVYYLRPVMANDTKSVPLTNVRNTFPTKMHKYFFTDSNNNVYMYDGKYNAPLPVIGSTLINMGNNIYKIVEDFSNETIYIIYNDKTVRQLTYTYNSTNYSYTQSTNTLLPYTNVKDVYASNKNAYILTDDGDVFGKGSSTYGQLGIMKTSSSVFINPLVSTLSFDMTKQYYSLIDIFKSSPNNKFYPAGQYAIAFNDIYNKYENFSGAGSMYILLDEEIEYESAYDDRENDPEYQRKWTINHDPNCFDNSMGLSQYHNPTGIPASPPGKLDKVGKYVINLKVRDNPKNDIRFKNDTNEDFNYYKWSKGNQNLTVYVHRKPIALMNISVTKNANDTFKIIATDGGSYDLDHTSRADKGIVEWQWAWRDQWEDSWHYERMNKSDATGDRAYIIALRVKDMEGVWSDWVYQTIDRRQPPIAKFDIIKNPITSLELAQIKDTSYAIMSNLTNWHWIVKRVNDNGSIGATLQEVKPTSSNTGAGGYDTSLNLTRTNPGVGKYRIYLRVKADNGLWSDGGTDAALNIDNMFYRDLTVNQALSIGDISVTGRWNHFRGWTDKFGVWKDVMKDTTYEDEKGVNRYPYRFLSYEMIDIKIKLEGYADEVIIDFPVNSGSGYSLGSMYYKDRLGYEYSYEEDLGYTVNFPYKGPFKNPLNPSEKDPTIEWSYILPLVHSSASWENNRLYQPYEIKITAKKGSHEVTQIKKIDITGNVDDLIFIQPVAR